VVVTIKYVGLVMRADNDGEGGMMALVALVRRLKDRIGIPAFGLLIALGIFGASLFSATRWSRPPSPCCRRSRG
jgi:KUP system potassium uptake protein